MNLAPSADRMALQCYADEQSCAHWRHARSFKRWHLLAQGSALLLGPSVCVAVANALPALALSLALCVTAMAIADAVFGFERASRQHAHAALLFAEMASPPFSAAV